MPARGFRVLCVFNRCQTWRRWFRNAYRFQCGRRFRLRGRWPSCNNPELMLESFAGARLVKIAQQSRIDAS